MWRKASKAHGMGRQFSWPHGMTHQGEKGHYAISHHQKGSNQAAGGSGSGWIGCQARRGVWDSELASSQGPQSSLVWRDGLARTVQCQARASSFWEQCLIPTGVSKGLRHDPGWEASTRLQGKRRPWVVQPRPKHSRPGSWLPDHSEPKSLEVVGLCSVPCANCDESRCPAGLSLPFPEYLGGHSHAGKRHLLLLGHCKQPRLVTHLGACPTPASSPDPNRSVPCSKTAIDSFTTVT